MKIRRANANPGRASLIVGIPKDMADMMGLSLGSNVTWALNAQGRWELVKIGEHRLNAKTDSETR
jgi:hypothetical protein